MMTDVSRREILLKDWWKLDRDEWVDDGSTPVSYFSVMQARRMYRADFPRPARTTPPNTNYYYLSDLRAWKKKHPDLFRGRRTPARAE
jgi:hypothetical protein